MLRSLLMALCFALVLSPRAALAQYRVALGDTVYLTASAPDSPLTAYDLRPHKMVFQGSVVSETCEARSPSGRVTSGAPLAGSACAASTDLSTVLTAWPQSQLRIPFTPTSDGDVGVWTVDCYATAVVPFVVRDGYTYSYCRSYPDVCGYDCDLGDLNFDLMRSDRYSFTVEVERPLPSIVVSGPDAVDVGESVTLHVSPYRSDLTYTWHVRRPNWEGWESLPAAGDSFTVEASRGGDWLFRAEVSNGRRTQSSPEFRVSVRDTRPHVSLAGETHITAGEELRIAATLGDEDGGRVGLSWRALQAPMQAFGSLDEVIPVVMREVSVMDQGTIILTLPTDGLSAGSYTFLAVVVDDEGNSADPVRHTVHVDGPVTARVTGPSSLRYHEFPLVLDSSASSDADTPCPDAVDGCHWLAPGETLQVTPGIVARRWYVESVPAVHADRYPLGPVSQAFFVPDTNARLTLDGHDIMPGRYRFALEVRDGEGNVHRTRHNVEVMQTFTDPVAITSSPRRYLVDPIAGLSEAVRIDGTQSYDPDNFFGGPFTPSPGIVRHAWRARPPPGCVPPILHDGPVLELYPVRHSPPPACLGTWQVTLTVTDDEGAEDAQSVSIMFGSCDAPSGVCIDSPTELAPVYVASSEAPDVPIYYHVDPSVYEQPELRYGALTQLDIVESATGRVVYTAHDSGMGSSDRGSVLVFHWNGLTSDGRRLPTADYDVRITLLNIEFEETGYAAVAARAIQAETPVVELGEHTRYVNHPGLQDFSRAVDVSYAVDGLVEGRTIDAVRMRVRNAAGLLVHDAVTAPAGPTGTLRWNGRAGSTLQPPGEYRVTVEAFRAGRLLATSAAQPVTLYRLRVVASGSTAERLWLLANLDDDNFDGTADSLQAPVAGENDLAELRFEVEPSMAGTATVSTSGLQLFDGETKTGIWTLPRTFTAMPALPQRAFVESTAAGRGHVELAFRTADGQDLVPARLETDSASLDLVDALGAPAASLLVSSFGQAFDGAGDLRESATGYFIDDAPERFVVRLVDPASNRDASAIEEVTVQLGTLLQMPYTMLDYVDPLHPLTLRETSAGSGEFHSQPQLLTSNDDDVVGPDDEHRTLLRSGSFVMDETRDDRTHRVGRMGDDYIAGGVRVEWRGPSGSSAARSLEVPVCGRTPDARRVVNMRTVVWSEPYDDIGYPLADGSTFGANNDQFDFEDLNGDTFHQPDEPSEPYLDLSHTPGATMMVRGGSVVPPLHGRGGVVSPQYIERELARARMSWAPACLTVRQTSFVREEAPKDPMNQSVHIDNHLSEVGVYDEPIIVDNHYAPLLNATEWLVVAGTSNITLSFGTAYGYTNLRAPATPQLFTFLGSHLAPNLRTLAHELGHLLTNAEDVVRPNWVLFPQWNTVVDDGIAGQRRFEPATIQQALAPSVPGFGGAGPVPNLMFHPY